VVIANECQISNTFTFAASPGTNFSWDVAHTTTAGNVPVYFPGRMRFEQVPQFSCFVSTNNGCWGTIATNVP